MKKSVIKYNFGPGKNNCTDDSIILTVKSEYDENIDFLIFADSRGFFLEAKEKSWTVRLLNFLIKKNKTCILAVRPKDFTGLISLLNFLNNNSLKIKNLIAQTGLAEYIPKSSAYIEDMLLQKEILFDRYTFKLKEFPPSLVMKKDKDNRVKASYEKLFSLEINTEEFKKKVVEYLEYHFEYSLLIGSLELTPDIKLERKRPKEYFNQLYLSNKFLYELNTKSSVIHYIQPLKPSPDKITEFTLDGAHYTAYAHEAIYNIVKEILNANILK